MKNTKRVEKMAVSLEGTMLMSIFTNLILKDSSLENLLNGNLDELVELNICDEKVAINDHTNKEVSIKGMFVLSSGEVAVMLDAPVYSLNALRLEDGVYHISTRSVAGVMKATGKGLDADVAEFNREINTDCDKYIVAYKLF